MLLSLSHLNTVEINYFITVLVWFASCTRFSLPRSWTFLVTGLPGTRYPSLTLRVNSICFFQQCWTKINVPSAYQYLRVLIPPRTNTFFYFLASRQKEKHCSRQRNSANPYKIEEWRKTLKKNGANWRFSKWEMCHVCYIKFSVSYFTALFTLSLFTGPMWEFQRCLLL